MRAPSSDFPEELLFNCCFAPATPAVELALTASAPLMVAADIAEMQVNKERKREGCEVVWWVCRLGKRQHKQLVELLSHGESHESGPPIVLGVRRDEGNCAGEGRGGW